MKNMQEMHTSLLAELPRVFRSTDGQTSESATARGMSADFPAYIIRNYTHLLIRINLLNDKITNQTF